jgi:hypothetical protein
MSQISALALVISVSLIVSTIVTVGEFAALLVVGYQIARSRPKAS